MPRVSITLSTYNGADSIAPTIESLLAQTFTDFELLIGINASKDNTLEIAEKYQKQDSRIRIINNKVNVGLGRNLNKLVSYMHPDSEYFAIAEDDDWYYPDRLQKEVDFLDANPDYGMVAGIGEFVSEDKVTLYPGMLLKGGYPEDQMEMLKLNYREQGKVTHTCMMVRKSVHVDHGLYFTQHYPNLCIDWDYVIRFCLYSKIGGIGEPLVRLDRRDARNSVTSNKNAQFRSARHFIRNKYWEFEGTGILTKEDLRYALNTQYLLEAKTYGRVHLVRNFLEMIKTYPGDARIWGLAKKMFKSAGRKVGFGK